MSKKYEKQTVKNIRYNTEEAIQFILSPGSDSELSELEDEDETETDENQMLTPRVHESTDDLSEGEPDYQIDQSKDLVAPQKSQESLQSTSRGSKKKLNSKVSKAVEDILSDEENIGDPPQLRRSKRQKTTVHGNYIDPANISLDSETTENDTGSVSSQSDSDTPESELTNPSTKKTKSNSKKENHTWRWRAGAPPNIDTAFKGDAFSRPPENFDEMNPIDFFRIFWTENITNLLVEQTNLYSVQNKGSSVKVTQEEIERFLGIHILMGIVKLPTYQMYWKTETRYDKVADVMSAKRYIDLRRYLHVVDNTTKEQPENKNDKLFKIRPVLDAIQENCSKIEPEPVQSIDEQIIPAKTRHSGIRQYNPMKPKKWGFKMFVRAGQSGFMYKFFLYAGKNGKDENSSCENVVLRLIENLPHQKNFKLCFDNWFSTLSLLLQLKEYGILTCATMRANRLANCPLSSEKELRKSGRGSNSHKVDKNSGIMLMRWFDNKTVQLASTYCSSKDIGTVKRWDAKSKSHIQVPCPEIVREYNSAMGGVDLADMLIALYRSPMKTKRWYLKVIIHAVDMCKVNAWILYRRYADQLHIPKKNQLPLLAFSSKVAAGLTVASKTLERSVGRPRKHKSIEDAVAGAGRRVLTPTPVNCVRTDATAHWPCYRDTKGRCRFCKKGIILTACMKCEVHLCFTSERNCFYDFHHH
ncbi:MAG: transposase [Bacteroidota bacterium]